VDANHWVLTVLTIPMGIVFGLLMPKNSVNKGPVFAMAYLAAMIIVFAGLEHTFDHRAAVFAAVVSGSLEIIVVLPVALVVMSGVLPMFRYLSGWRGLTLLLLFTPATMFLLAAIWHIAHASPAAVTR
jgi:hypothetical protein